MGRNYGVSGIMEKFLASLQNYHSKISFNPWADYDPSCDIGIEAPEIRRENLLRYLTLRKNARYLFIAEGLGYQGGHFSGMAMTSERILLGHHPMVRPQVVLGEWHYQRTSNPQSHLLNAKQKAEGFNEPTATIMWGCLAQHHLAPFQTILWNIFPFHPFKESGILTNRTPNREELETGIEYAQKLMSLVPHMQIIAIGRKSADTLEKFGISCQAVPHPSMGGANKFRAALSDIFTNE
jgi:hypothetical protein